MSIAGRRHNEGAMMGYYVSNIIGIRTGGVFSPTVDIEDMKGRVANIVAEMRDGDHRTDIEDDPSHCGFNGKPI